MALTTVRKPVTDTNSATQREKIFQVVLHNDDWNTADHVVRCLMQVFGHEKVLAVKIMMEAHEKGMAVAEVEAETPARMHRDQLQSFGLSATVESL